MEEHGDKIPGLDGKLVAVLLDQEEYPSNIGEVVALSDKQVLVLRRDWHELTHFRLEPLDVNDCRAIEYRKETAWSRVIAGVVCSLGAAFLAVTIVIGFAGDPARSAPLIILTIGLMSFGIRFLTSTYRHVIRFEMPGETLTWRSPAIDFKSKAGAAHAVREFARTRSMLADQVPDQ